MSAVVQYLSVQDAEKVFHESDLREFITEGWHVVRSDRDWGFGRYVGPFDTITDAQRGAVTLTDGGLVVCVGAEDAGGVLGAGNEQEAGG